MQGREKQDIQEIQQTHTETQTRQRFIVHHEIQNTQRQTQTGIKFLGKDDAQEKKNSQTLNKVKLLELIKCYIMNFVAKTSKNMYRLMKIFHYVLL